MAGSVIVDRIERHDIINAVGLAAVLLIMALGLVLGARALLNVVNDGVVDTGTTDEVIAGDNGSADEGEGGGADNGGTGDAGSGDGDTPSPDTDDEDAEGETTPDVEVVIHPPAEVTVRVGNGARRTGVASSGTDILVDAGYPALAPRNAPTVQNSVVYYAEGHQGDAVVVAGLMNMAATAIAPMPADPGVPIDGAQLIVILGTDTTLG